MSASLAASVATAVSPSTTACDPAPDTAGAAVPANPGRRCVTVAVALPDVASASRTDTENANSASAAPRAGTANEGVAVPASVSATDGPDSCVHDHTSVASPWCPAAVADSSTVAPAATSRPAPASTTSAHAGSISGCRGVP